VTNTATNYSSTTGLELDALLDKALEASRASDRLDLIQVGRLLGDDPRLSYTGPHCYRLCGAALHGSLGTIENPRFAEYFDADGKVIASREREHREFLTITRAMFTAWLDEHGTDADRASRAAVWAHMVELN